MMEALLSTKLYPPPAPPKLIRRPRLLARLDEPTPLILISAPPGFGKTTLLGEWRAARGASMACAWLSLDPDDNDAPRFVAYLIAALQRVKPETGVTGALLLQTSPATPLRTILVSWLNDLSQLDSQVVLVLDDYHLINAQPVHDLVAFLLEHRPPALRVILITRNNPAILLARWRGRGELTEIRAEALRFTADETETFLNRLMNLNVSAEEVSALESRTEGWIAGLQMAALALEGTLALQGQEDRHTLMAAFTGGHRFVGDYLTEEVFNHQPQATQAFLLATSALDRLCAPLCDAVTLGHNPARLFSTNWGGRMCF
jgi:LuxR family transcriptional regulator, maltose regulon positive regulatory protein